MVAIGRRCHSPASCSPGQENLCPTLPSPPFQFVTWHSRELQHGLRMTRYRLYTSEARRLHSPVRGNLTPSALRKLVGSRFTCNLPAVEAHGLLHFCATAARRCAICRGLDVSELDHLLPSKLGRCSGCVDVRNRLRDGWDGLGCFCHCDSFMRPDCLVFAHAMH